MKKEIRVGRLVAALIGLLIWGIDPRVGAQSPNRVGLVVQFGDGRTITRCVEFTEAEISGYDVLARSGLSVIASASSGIGTAICQIEGEGCPAENCFCKCRGATCTYWSYWHLDGAAWRYSNLGASNYRVGNGQVEGWRWGNESPPPVIPFDQICAPPATSTPLLPTATPTPLPPTATSTPLPPTATPTSLPKSFDLASTATLTVTPERMQPTGVASPTVTLSMTPLPAHTPVSSPTASLTPTSTPTGTSTPTATPTQVPLSTHLSGPSANRPAPTATAESPKQVVMYRDYIFFAVCLAFLFVVLVLTVRKK